MSKLGLDEILNLAKRAVSYDGSGNVSAAAYYYRQVSRLLTENFSQSEAYSEKAAEYMSRATWLEQSQVEVEDESDSTAEESDIKMALFLLDEGLDLDEEEEYDEAVQRYSSAVEFCIKAKNSVSDPKLKSKLSEIATDALNRAEKIKSDKSPKLSKKAATSGATAQKTRAGYTEEEKMVLAKTSIINAREYVPFMTVDFKERFAYPMPYNDKDGKLSLSVKQKLKFKSWRRPEEFMTNPKIFEVIDCYSVKQTIVSDCSFLASIAVAAQHEKRFGKKLITSIIFPQNRKGQPVYNPCGKYMIKLRINGVARKIVIDDFLPVGNKNELLCSYSSNRNELWVSLLEKAYIKVMGGYDFPGSNSNIDLYAITGWIPERLAIQKGSSKFDKDAEFKKILERFHRGDVLVTFATGPIGEFAADRAGLVPTHAYAMLDVRLVNGVQLFLLKNPWSHLRWKGNYSELDSQHWTKEMKTALNYDPDSAANFDNGVFWIDFDSVIEFFEVIYLSWNPYLFVHRYSMHQSWDAGVGPVKDMFYFSNNPQYILELTKPGSGALWILLSRHITDIEDFKNNKEYIALLVYKNEGKRIYYPVDPPPFLDAVKINTPLYLCQTVLKEDTPRKFTLVVSQFEKTSTIFYSIRVFSTLPFTLKKLSNPFKYKKELKDGEWKGQSAGGCSNFDSTYKHNPRYRLKVRSECRTIIELKGPKQFFIGFDVVSVSVKESSSPKYFKLKQSGPFRPGFVVLDLELLPGAYDIIPCTFRPGQESPFFLTVQCSDNFEVEKVLKANN